MIFECLFLFLLLILLNRTFLFRLADTLLTTTSNMSSAVLTNNPTSTSSVSSSNSSAPKAANTNKTNVVTSGSGKSPTPKAPSNTADAANVVADDKATVNDNNNGTHVNNNNNTLITKSNGHNMNMQNGHSANGGDTVDNASITSKVVVIDLVSAAGAGESKLIIGSGDEKTNATTTKTSKEKPTNGINTESTTPAVSAATDCNLSRDRSRTSCNGHNEEEDEEIRGQHLNNNNDDSSDLLTTSAEGSAMQTTTTTTAVQKDATATTNNSDTLKKKLRLSSGRQQTKKAKRVRFFRNGDKFYPGLVLPVSNERYRSFESLTEDLTRVLGESIKVPGAVRTIFSVDGKKVTGLEDLEDGKCYVCSCNNEVFKRLDYSQNNKLNNRLSR